jgi:hypothetical protein
MRAFGESKEAYHRGDCHKVSVLRFVQNAKEIYQQIMTLLLGKSNKNGVECEPIHKVNGFERVLGCSDACFAKFAIIIPTDEEMFQAREACGAMIREWRSQGFKMPIKAHICEDHMCDFEEA